MGHYVKITFVRTVKLRRFTMHKGESMTCCTSHGSGKSLMESLAAGAGQFLFDQTPVYRRDVVWEVTP